MAIFSGLIVQPQPHVGIGVIPVDCSATLTGLDDPRCQPGSYFDIAGCIGFWTITHGLSCGFARNCNFFS
jgi:hypothetical protein